MSDSFNIFDLFVVVISLVEIAALFRPGSNNGVTALRSFKTLRLLKSFRVLRLLRMFRCAADAAVSVLCLQPALTTVLSVQLADAQTRRFDVFRYLDSLRALGEVLMESAGSFLAVSFLCLLFLMVFTILGLHMFGDLVLDIVSPNFHGFYQSFLTTFQVRFVQYCCVATCRSQLCG